MQPILLCKSFGLGILLVELVPTPNDTKSHELVRSKISKAGFDIYEIFLNPDDFNQAYILMNEGHIPTRMELDQFSKDELDQLAKTALTNPNLLERFQMLKPYI